LDVCSSAKRLGIVGNIAKPNWCEIYSQSPIPVGTYISIPLEYLNPVTGDVEHHCFVGVISSNKYQGSVPISPSAMINASVSIEGFLGTFSPAYATIFADISIASGGIEIKTPKVPPKPGAAVFLASSRVLQMLFSRSESAISIGNLMGVPDVEVRVNIDALSKHLLIAGTTGSGKSNTVAVLAERIASLGGMVVIYDVHGEYVNLMPESSNVEVRSIDVKINPLIVEPSTLARMIVPEPSASIQRRIITSALRSASKVFSEAISRFGVTEQAVKFLEEHLKSSMRTVVDEEPASESREKDFDDVLLKMLRDYIVAEIYKQKRRALTERSVEAAVLKIEEFFEFAALSLKTPPVSNLISPGRILVLNVSLLDDIQRSYMLRIVADEILYTAKRSTLTGSPRPVILFLEEAHNFLSSDMENPAQPVLERVAREGRKFGVVISIVTQRPRNLNQNVVSQIQNFIFMKLVQEADIRFILNVSDSMTEEMAHSLVSMDVGEAIVTGEWIGRFPVYAKIHKHRGKTVGATPSLYQLWSSIASERRRIDDRMTLRRITLDELKNLI